MPEGAQAALTQMRDGPRLAEIATYWFNLAAQLSTRIVCAPPCFARSETRNRLPPEDGQYRNEPAAAVCWCCIRHSASGTLASIVRR
jgi:hypothetical protein